MQPINTVIWIGIVAATAIAAQVIAIALIIQHWPRWRATVAVAVTIVVVAVETTLACRLILGGWL